MGDEQARAIEKAFDKPEGWMDRDPAFDEALRELDRKVREPTAPYNPWPFRRVDSSRIRRLTPAAHTAVEDALLGALDVAERLSQHAA